MRRVIQLSAGLFIVLGVITFVVAALVAVASVTAGAASSYADLKQMIGLMLALAGLVSGASIVLVGGTAYLLSSIDERIERAVLILNVPKMGG